MYVEHDAIQELIDKTVVYAEVADCVSIVSFFAECIMAI